MNGEFLMLMAHDQLPLQTKVHSYLYWIKFILSLFLNNILFDFWRPGYTWKEKIYHDIPDSGNPNQFKNVRQLMADRDCDMLVLTAIDEIACKL